MKTQRRNKIIAREIILFFSIFVIIGLTWLFIIIRNHYYYGKINDFNGQLSSLNYKIDSTQSEKISSVLFKIKNIYEQINQYDATYKNDVTINKFIFSMQDSGYSRKIYDYLGKNDREYLYKYSFREFIRPFIFYPRLRNESLVDSLFKVSNKNEFNKSKLLIEKKDIEISVCAKTENIFSDEQIYKFLIWTFVILCIILYPLRLIIIIIRWSIKTLSSR